MINDQLRQHRCSRIFPLLDLQWRSGKHNFYLHLKIHRKGCWPNLTCFKENLCTEIAQKFYYHFNLKLFRRRSFCLCSRLFIWRKNVGFPVVKVSWESVIERKAEKTILWVWALPNRWRCLASWEGNQMCLGIYYIGIALKIVLNFLVFLFENALKSNVCLVGFGFYPIDGAV
jgi:hypothetical protein